MFRHTKQGALDVIETAAPMVRDAMTEFGGVADSCLRDGPGQVVLDLSDVSLVDSAGLEAMLDLQDDCLRRGGLLKIAGPTHLVRDVLRITGVDEHIEVFPDLVAAMGSFAE